jgi:hemolysin D
MFESLKKHWQVLRESWSAESERRKTKLKLEEKDFLPAALEILEKPASPVGRAVMWSIVAMAVAAVAWATLGFVDVVAVAEGRLIPRARVKIVQPLEIGVVRAIHVRDGQRVKAGQVLIELDPTVTGAEAEQARKALRVAEVSRARGNALMNHLSTGVSTFETPEGVDLPTAATQQALIDAQVREYEAKLANLKQQRLERENDLAATGSQLSKLKSVYDLITQQVTAREPLVEKGWSPRLQFLELKERQVTFAKDIEIQKENLAKAKASLATLDTELERTTAEFRKTVIGDLAEAENQVNIQTQNLRKAEQRLQLQQLTSPVDGVVQQLAVHTLGGVVQPAQALLVVVPGSGELLVEAMVQNKDIGFVHAGQPVEVKLEAFPFTKHGVIHGVLEDISTDAVQDEKRGLIYPARVKLKAQMIDAGGRKVPLGAGMQVSAEIKTGERRLIDYVLSPIIKYREESFRER